jgi:hypothetical protein
MMHGGMKKQILTDPRTGARKAEFQTGDKLGAVIILIDGKARPSLRTDAIGSSHVFP